MMHAIEVAQPVTEPSTGGTAARELLAETAKLTDAAQPAEKPAA